MDNEDKRVEIEKTNVQRSFDGSALGSTFIKYAAYIAIIFGVLYFIAKYILPMFK